MNIDALDQRHGLQVILWDWLRGLAGFRVANPTTAPSAAGWADRSVGMRLCVIAGGCDQ
jgi:hypothetical protein